MTRSIALTVMLILVAGTITANGQSTDAIEFLNTKMAEIKGEIPLTMTAGMPAPKCGTPVSVAVKQYALQTGDDLLGMPLARPDYLPDTLGGQNILVHYTTTGIHAPYQVNVDIDPADGVPDFINRVFETFEYVWDYETGTLGYRTPLTDSGRGGDDRYDIYVEHLGAGFFGFTNPEDVVDQYKANSYISIENDFAGSSYATHPVDGARVTAAHEFFHAIEFSYDAFEFDFGNVNDPNTYRPWWLEASATWMEDVVYDDINDYIGYLPYFLGYSWMGLGSFSYNYGDARSYHPYGACLWPIFLSEKYGTDIVRMIWDICETVPGYNALNAMESLLGNRSSSLSDGFTEFTVWNFHSGPFADQVNFYSEGASFPPVDTTGYIDSLTYNPSLINYMTNPPEHLAANYIVIRSRNEAGGIVVNFDGQNLSGAAWHTVILGYWPGESQWQDMGVDPLSGVGADEFRDWDSFQDMIIIPSVSGVNPIHDTNFSYQGTVAFDPTLVGPADLSRGFSIYSAYPSPYIIDGSGAPLMMSYSFEKRYDRDEIRIWVFDAFGTPVVKLPDNALSFTSPGMHAGGLTWNGKNDDGRYVASGIYLVHMEAGNKSSDIKIAVINGSR